MLGETWSYKPSCPDYIFLGSPLQAYICLFGPNFFCQTPLQLADPTELQLDGVGVDFVFPYHKKEEEGITHT